MNTKLDKIANITNHIIKSYFVFQLFSSVLKLIFLFYKDVWDYFSKTHYFSWLVDTKTKPINKKKYGITELLKGNL